jgi:drug/metabolite transporter (DMT)-like permease
MNNDLRGALVALAAFGIYATHDVILKTLGATYAPFQIVFFAVLFGFPMTIFLLISDKTDGNLRPVHPWWTALRVAASVVASASVVFAFSTLPLSQVYAILFATPVLITLLSVPILGEVIRLRRWIAVIVGLAGVLIVLQPGSAPLGLGHAAALTGAFGSSLASITIRKIGNDERSIVLLLYPMLANFIVMGAILPFVYIPMPIEDLGAVLMVAILGVVAMSVMIGAYNRAEAVLVAPMQYSQILWATAYGFIFFDEKLDRSTVIGAAVIIASGLYILMRESRSRPGGKRPVLRTTNLRFEFGSKPRIGDFFRMKRRRPGAGPGENGDQGSDSR